MTVGETVLTTLLLMHLIVWGWAIWFGRKRLGQVSTQVDHNINLTNSRMTQLIKLIRKTSTATGFARGRAERNRKTVKEKSPPHVAKRQRAGVEK